MLKSEHNLNIVSKRINTEKSAIVPRNQDEFESPNIDAYFESGEYLVDSGDFTSGDIVMANADQEDGGIAFVTNKNVWLLIEGSDEPWVRIALDEIVDVRANAAMLPFIRMLSIYTASGVRYRVSFSRVFGKFVQKSIREHLRTHLR